MANESKEGLKEKSLVGVQTFLKRGYVGKGMYHREWDGGRYSPEGHLVDRWLHDNSPEEVERTGDSESQGTIFDGTYFSNVRVVRSWREILAKGQKYDVEVTVRFSPDETRDSHQVAGVPKGLKELLDKEGFELVKK